MLPYNLPFCQRTISRRVLDSEDEEPANTKKPKKRPNGLNEGDEESNEQRKKAKTSAETDESEEESTEAKGQVSPIW
jgi:hypothetical protein